MGILRDEGGYVLVLRRPAVLIGSNAELQERENRTAPEVIQSVQAAVCATPHCCFFCAWCGQPILLPNDAIGSPFGNPDARKIEVRSIATVCRTCMHIGNYSMFRACRGFDTRHKIVHSLSGGSTRLLNWLRCEERTCTARVPLFARFDQDPEEGDTQAAGWLWDDLTCASAHRIKPIPLDPTFQLPLRTFAEFR